VELIARDISKRFGERVVLRNLSLSVREGEVYVLVGPNGSGKTTLMNILASVARPDSGHIRLDETDVASIRNSYRRRVGFLSHPSMLYSQLTARENLRFLGSLYGVKDLANRIEMMLGQVGLQSEGDELVRNFSRGMLQRLSLARAFLHNPGVLLLDEPYSGLDQAAISMLTDILKKFSLHRRIVILTSHNLEAGLDVATRGGILFGQRISHESDGKPDASFVTKYLSLIGGEGGW
jgi:heme exporter protein A